jgi:mRNA interferase RelE/StbE
MERKNSFKGYHVVFTSNAEKDLKKIDSKIAKKIYQKFEELVLGLPNLDVIKMQGNNDNYRLRCGDYRAIFQIKKEIVVILVIKIGHRKDVYE